MKTSLFILLLLSFVESSFAQSIQPCVYEYAKIYSKDNKILLLKSDEQLVGEYGKEMSDIVEMIASFEDSRTANMEEILVKLSQDADALVPKMTELVLKKREQEIKLQEEIDAMRANIRGTMSNDLTGLAAIKRARMVQADAMARTDAARIESLLQHQNAARTMSVMMIEALTELKGTKARINKLLGITNPHFRGKDDSLGENNNPVLQ